MEKIQNNGKDIRTSGKRKLSSNNVVNIHLGLGLTKVKTITYKEPFIRLFGGTNETALINNIQPITGEDKSEWMLKWTQLVLSLAMIMVH